ncbi:MAG TPA: COX15/CtaA family protein [Ilumatobacteraceae bacterium]|jgi:heme a synthase|nr:COX15/CtaA family protein [Ilumatobacteraceae bacterium]
MASDRPRFTMSLRRFRQIAIVTVAGVCFLTVAGAIVRLTGSGLGCDDWPNCNNERFIDVSTGHAAVEQLNRLLSGLIAVPTLLMAVGSFRVWPHRRGLRLPSVAVLGTILANGVVGGLAVLGDLHPTLVQSHFVLAMVSIAFGALAIHRSNPDPVLSSPAAGSRSTRLLVTVGVLMAAALVTGTVVTGTGPHAGDESARRYGFDISTVAMVHSVTVWFAVAAFLGAVVALRRDGAFERVSAKVSSWMFIAVLQGGIGYVQYFNGVPELLVVAHIVGSVAMWIATLQLVFSVVEPLPDERRIHAAETRNEPSIAAPPVATA